MLRRDGFTVEGIHPETDVMDGCETRSGVFLGEAGSFFRYVVCGPLMPQVLTVNLKRGCGSGRFGVVPVP